MSTPHQVTDACADVHCYAHGVDEPQTGWLVCGECGHVFPSAGALRRDYRREYWRIASMEGVSPPIPLWRRIRTAATVRASRVTFCPHCLHDFSWMPPRRRWLRRAGDAA